VRYTEAKAQSAELLRLALAQMGRHVAAFNPITFTLWYEVVAGINPRLAAAIERLAADGTRLDDDSVLRLYKAYVAPPDMETMERIGGEMQRLMSGVAQSASQAGTRAGTFGAQLNGLSAALASKDVAQLTPHLSEVLAGTAEMKTSVEALQQKVSMSQDEIQRLRGDLERARGEALLDALTGVLNRKGFEQKLHALLKEAPPPGRCHCLVMLDIDHFKKVNDTHGHVMGDRVIQGLGEILRAVVNGGPHAAARYGGEEFAILLPQATLDESAQLAEAVRARTKAMKIRDRRTQEVLVTVTISGGVAAMQEGDDAIALVSRADAALYESKKLGRDRVTRA
jgi:diguanylate cyclase